jgi:hypothetical protein
VLLGVSMYPSLQGDTSQVIDSERNQDLLAFAGIGLVYGAVAQSIWVISGLRVASIRLVASMIVLFVGAIFLSILSAQVREYSLSTSPREIARLAAQLGGMAIAQSILFFFLGIVSWQSEIVTRDRPRRQFGILDIGFLTLATAVVLSIAVRQETPIRAADFWMVAVGMWVVFPIITAMAAHSVTASRWDQRLVRMSVAVGLAASCCVGLANLEIRFERFDEDDLAMLTKLYGTVLAAFCFCSWLFPMAGNIDRSK